MFERDLEDLVDFVGVGDEFRTSITNGYEGIDAEVANVDVDG